MWTILPPSGSPGKCLSTWKVIYIAMRLGNPQEINETIFVWVASWKERTTLLRWPNNYEKGILVVLTTAKWKQAFYENFWGFPGEWDQCIPSKYLSSDSLMKCQLVTVCSLCDTLAWDTWFTAEVPFVIKVTLRSPRPGFLLWLNVTSVLMTTCWYVIKRHF